MRKIRLDLEVDNRGNFDYELVKKAMAKIVEKTRLQVSPDDLLQALDQAIERFCSNKKQVICYGDIGRDDGL